MRVVKVVLAPRWLLRHVFVVLAVGVCVGFGKWQLGRAQSRHSILNWSYTVEWGLFGAFAVLCWAWYLRDELLGGPAKAKAQESAPAAFFPAPVPVTEEDDPELAAYNRYLAGLNTKESR